MAVWRGWEWQRKPLFQLTLPIILYIYQLCIRNIIGMLSMLFINTKSPFFSYTSGYATLHPGKHTISNTHHCKGEFMVIRMKKGNFEI